MNQNAEADSDNNCIFCRIIRSEIPTSKVIETETVIVIRDIQPQAPHHYLAIPKHHLPSLNDLSANDRKNVLPNLFEIADICAEQLGFKSTGYRTVINNQAQAGQTVFHLHMHILGGTRLRGDFGA